MIHDIFKLVDFFNPQPRASVISTETLGATSEVEKEMKSIQLIGDVRKDLDKR